MVHKYIAHKRKSDGECQSLESHLLEVGELASFYAEKINLSEVGKLLGITHDFGKYSSEFQNYIKSATGEINYDEDAYINPIDFKGKIDHSTAGSQRIWDELQKNDGIGKFCGQALALCVASHHSGLIDCLSPQGVNIFCKRMNKDKKETHLEECLKNSSPEILEQIKKMLQSKSLMENIKKQIEKFMRKEQHGQNISEQIQCFYISLWVRFLFSCLIDADRTNSSEFETPKRKKYRINLQKKLDWKVAINRMEKYFSSLSDKNKINKIRRDISSQCKERAFDKQGIYTLTVPTGGGKTLSSLRYAVHHAEKHNLDRIIYIIPYTSIIEQNAGEIRKVLERKKDSFRWVLEHHSNLEPDNLTWHSKLAAENWNAPIVFTTMVQFLQILFAGGTRSPRRFHQLAKSVLILDEIQTLPIRCVHLLCNSFNFLNTYTKTSIILCTATQPLLNKELKNPRKGHLTIKNDLVGNIEEVRKLFLKMNRVNIKKELKEEGWTKEEIAELAASQLKKSKSSLVITNTKLWARDIFKILNKQNIDAKIIHLSAYMCPAHRKKVLEEAKYLLKKNEKVICVSTQLIEAGVDIDFETVIRFLAGLDSIAQAAGRCNRHNKKRKGDVYIINPKDEPTGQLEDIKIGAEKAERVLRENDGRFIESPEIMDLYFKYYFFDRGEEMDYPLNKRDIGRRDTLLNLLSTNCLNPCTWKLLRQSFMSAGKVFKAIDAPTKSIIVPYGEEGLKIVTDICSSSKNFNPSQYFDALQRAQSYGVNLFPHDLKELEKNEGLHKVDNDGVYMLNECFYDETFGISMEKVSNMSFMEC